MTDFTNRKVQNATDDGGVPRGAWCPWCGNSGVVMLEGAMQVATTEYSRGSAPCKWCDQGQLRYAEWTSASGQRRTKDATGGAHVTFHQRINARSDYSLHDVELTGVEPRRSERFVPDAAFLAEREAAGVRREAMMAMFPRRIWPAGWSGPRPGGVLGVME